MALRYPVNRFKEEWNLTAGLPFGAPTPYGFHDGWDLNKNGGGDIELGVDILAISNGELVYWHGAKHPNSGFGYHSVYKIVGEWGTRWVHQAHCQSDITPAPKAITQNERIAHVGNSGTGWAHIHFSVFKVDPAGLRDGIDTIARTQTELNNWWEDPIAFIERYMGAVTPPALVITDDTLIPQIENKSVRDIKNELFASREMIKVLQGKIEKAKVDLA